MPNDPTLLKTFKNIITPFENIGVTLEGKTPV